MKRAKNINFFGSLKKHWYCFHHYYQWWCSKVNNIATLQEHNHYNSKKSNQDFSSWQTNMSLFFTIQFLSLLFPKNYNIAFELVKSYFCSMFLSPLSLPLLQLLFQYVLFFPPLFQPCCKPGLYNFNCWRPEQSLISVVPANSNMGANLIYYVCDDDTSHFCDYCFFFGDAFTPTSIDSFPLTDTNATTTTMMNTTTNTITAKLVSSLQLQLSSSSLPSKTSLSSIAISPVVAFFLFKPFIFF